MYGLVEYEACKLMFESYWRRRCRARPQTHDQSPPSGTLVMAAVTNLVRRHALRQWSKPGDGEACREIS